MKRFIAGQDRTQSTLLPELLDEYITEENPVRVIDLFVDQLDLKSLGFEGVVPADNFTTSNFTISSPTFNGLTFSLAADNSNPGSYNLVVGGGGVAPEMNASQIPQVGLLLGCLFFLYGRKREDASSIEEFKMAV